MALEESRGLEVELFVQAEPAVPALWRRYLRTILVLHSEPCLKLRKERTRTTESVGPWAEEGEEGVKAYLGLNPASVGDL